MKANHKIFTQSLSGARPLHSSLFKSSMKSVLKKLRTSQPFNRIATSTTRGLLSAAGMHSEAVIKHLHRAGTVQSSLPNGRMLYLWSRADDWVSNQVYWRGWSGYEPETAPLFFRLATRARVTFDVGAFVGYFTLLAAHANPEGRVYAFEPLADAYERLEKNVALNRLTNVSGQRTAVGDTEGEAEFFYLETGMSCSSSLSYDFMRGATGVRSSLVSVIRLDRFVKEQQIDRVDLVKIDTESTEPQVLGGMSETLDRDRPVIVCEVLEGRSDGSSIEAMLAPLGYRYYLLTPEGPVERDRIAGHPTWLNYLFTTGDPEVVAPV